MPQDNENKTIVSVEAVTARLPEFWTFNPTIWFVQAENQFELSRITADPTKKAVCDTSITARSGSRLSIASRVKDKIWT